MQRELSFLLGVFFELLLLLFAFGWTLIFNEPLLTHFRWTFRDAFTGILAAVPLLAFLVWTTKSKLPVLVRHRALLNSIVPRLFGGWATWQLAAISLCAGVCEEALFRGALQTSLAARIGNTAAIGAVALLFGASHLLSWTYGIIAAFIGVYLGLLFLVSANLLVPVAAHTVYDFVALLYLLKWHERRE